MKREDVVARARREMWAAWLLSQDEIGSVAADTLMNLGMLVPEGGAQELEKLRERVAELETGLPVLVCRECAGPVQWVKNANGGWWNHTSPVADGHGVVPKPAEDPCRPCGCPKRFDRHADGCPVEESADKLTRLLAPTQALRETDGEHYAAVHHDYRQGRDLPETGGTK